MPTNLKQPRRAPNGVMTSKPIPMRLMPAEYSKVTEIAKNDDRSMASVCRLMFLRGLAAYEQDRSSHSAT